MAATTGPILAIGAITMVNQSIVHGKPIDVRVPVATGVAAGLFALAERGWREGATALAWMALVTVLFTRVDRSIPSPSESFLGWWNQTK